LEELENANREEEKFIGIANKLVEKYTQKPNYKELFSEFLKNTLEFDHKKRLHLRDLKPLFEKSLHSVLMQKLRHDEEQDPLA